jgi:putative transposase
VAEVIRKMGVTEQTFCRWKKTFGTMAPSEVKKLKQLEDENKRLKQMVADLSLDKHMLQEVLSKKFDAGPAAGACGRPEDGVPGSDPPGL